MGICNIPEVNDYVPHDGDDDGTTAEHNSASQAHTVPILSVSCFHCFQSCLAEQMEDYDLFGRIQDENNWDGEKQAQRCCDK